jgi:hypothetical protein
MYCTFIQSTAAEKNSNSHIDELCKIYILDVLNIGDEFATSLIGIYKHILLTYSDLLYALIGIDDNQ